MLERTKTVLTRFIEIAIIIAVLLVSLSYIHFRYFKESSIRHPQLLSSELSNYIDHRLDTIGVVNGVQIIEVNLNRNIRYIIHAHWEIPELQELYRKFSDEQITTEIPVFLKDDVAQNMRIIRLMNHEFDCSPFNDTLIYKLAPSAAKHIAVVCSISIPPAFTEFKGMVSVSLDREPTVTEREDLKIILMDISARIHREISVAKK